MAKEYICDNCNVVFYHRDCMYPVDERKDYCSEECFEEGRQKGQVGFCTKCKSDVTLPHTFCHGDYFEKKKREKK